MRTFAELKKAIADLSPERVARRGLIQQAPQRAGSISVAERGHGLSIRRAGKLGGRKKIRPKKDPVRLLERRRRSRIRQTQSMSSASPRRRQT